MYYCMCIQCLQSKVNLYKQLDHLLFRPPLYTVIREIFISEIIHIYIKKIHTKQICTKLYRNNTKNSFENIFNKGSRVSKVLKNPKLW